MTSSLNMLPRHALHCIAQCLGVYAIFSGEITDRGSVGIVCTEESHEFGIELDARDLFADKHGSVDVPIHGVVLPCTPFEVRRVIVQGVVVEMSTMGTWRSGRFGTNKGFQDQDMDAERGFVQRDLEIASPRLEYEQTGSSSESSTRDVVAANAAMAADFVSRVTGDGLPFFHAWSVSRYQGVA